MQAYYVMALSFYRAYRFLANIVRSNKLLFRCLFGYRPLAVSDDFGEYWDWTTLVLKRALHHFVTPKTSLLDMGTGSLGVLAIYARLRLHCKVAVDYVPEVICSAQKHVEALGLDIQCCSSDLFSSVSRRFNIIAFNAPYLDADRGKELGILSNSLSEKRFSGGKRGIETIARFLQNAPESLLDDGIVLLGVCCYHMSDSVIQEVIQPSRFVVLDAISLPCVPSVVYVLSLPRD